MDARGNLSELPLALCAMLLNNILSQIGFGVNKKMLKTKKAPDPFSSFFFLVLPPGIEPRFRD